MRIGSLCSGYGGLELGVQAVYGGTTAWVSDIDKGACKILAHRFPGVPNIGDFTKTDWADVEPVDLICAGFPCQPVSHAGKRLGDDDERWLWDDVLRAVREVRPGVVALENVRGLLTARDGELFGRVIGSLADIGYDANWHGIKAAAVGAPHGRFRVFIVATDAGGLGGREALKHDGGRAAAHDRAGLPHEPDRDALRSGPERGLTLLKTPTSQLAINGGSQHPDKRKAGGHGPTLADEVEHLLPTPTSMDSKASGGGYNGQSNVTLTDATARQPDRWGQYAAAIARWESLTRPSPPPTELTARGSQALSPRFVEWLMGLPAGWVTDVPGISRNEALRALGNGVVPQQAAEALRVMASWEVAA